MADSRLPRKRTDRLTEVDLIDEIVVHDLKSGDTHALNGTAAKVWRGLDQRRSVTALATSLGNEGAATEAAVWVALRDFAKHGLLDGPLPPRARGLSRRQLLHALTAAGVAIPFIRSVSAQAPPAVSAMSCSDTAAGCSAICPTNPCCACGLTTEATTVCVVPLCDIAFVTPCTSSTQCPRGYVCLTGPQADCCGVFPGFCVALCTPTTTRGAFCGGTGTLGSKKKMAARDTHAHWPDK